MKEAVLNLVKDYPNFKFPGHRYKSQSMNSGEEFRDDILIPFLKSHKGDNMTINMDGAVGFPPSFLEESFGGCILKGFNEVKSVKIIGLDEIEQERIKRYITKAIENSK